jgi:hypothetical protein
VLLQITLYLYLNVLQVHNLVVAVSTKSHSTVTQDAIDMMVLLSILPLALNLDLTKESTRIEVMRNSSGKLDQRLSQQKWLG